MSSSGFCAAMGIHENIFSELLELVKSWFPLRSEPAYVSKDFWMPDNSCRVCYDCDIQFTFFIRKHHCRLCGRVFCGNCTANSIPVTSADPQNRKIVRDRVRVCTFCLKQWQQEVAAAANLVHIPNSCMGHSFSTSSILSTGSSGTLKSSAMTASSMSYSNEPYQQVSCNSMPSPVQSMIFELGNHKQDILDMDPPSDAGSTCSNHISYSLNKSDFYDNVSDASHSNSEKHHFQHHDSCYAVAECDEIDQFYNRNKFNLAEVNLASEDVCSPVDDCTESQVSFCFDNVAEVGCEHGDDCDISSSSYGMEGTIEPVDFANNELLWFPPKPEDDEDENNALPIDDEDEYAIRDLFISKSFDNDNGEFHIRDRSRDEYMGAMKNVVGGHFKPLIAQLLQVENLSVGAESEKESWLEIITSLSWEAATFLKPDMSSGGRMDPGGYVKVKCIACGHRNQSVVVRGVVCKKNVAHRQMMSNIEKPRLLILGGALEYQRLLNSLSSFDTLRQQEMDHLKITVERIDSQHPHVLLVEKSVARFAQDYLLARNISLVLNVKRPLLEHISRCTGAQLVPSIDHLSSPKLGHCDIFRVERFLEEHGSAGQEGKKMMKTLMFFEDCPRPLGCTILLKGANGDELKKVKHVVKYAVCAAYHLALETSFLADEGASLPEIPLKSPINIALLEKLSGNNRSVSTIPDFASSASNTTVPYSNINANNVQSASKTTKTEKMELNISHTSSSISGMAEVVSGFSTQPSDSERLHMWKFSHAVDAIEQQNAVSSAVQYCTPTFPHDLLWQFPKTKHDKSFVKSLITKTILADVHEHTIVKLAAPEDNIKKDNSNVTLDALNLHQANSSLQEGIQTTEESLPTPSDHPNILVSLSSHCVWKGTVCVRSHLFRITCYASFDKPLGRFLRDDLFDQCHLCSSCDMPSEAHIYCYTHQQGSLTISVRRLLQFHLHGERDGKIWMWHRCQRCPQFNGFPPTSRRVVMSDAAWGLSFGKFLELSFSNHAAATMVASCGHSLHRDCLRFYGFGKMVACFQYASINVHSIYLPPRKIGFNYEYQDWIHQEANEVVEMKEMLFAEVLSSLKQIEVKKPIWDVKPKSPKFKILSHKLEEMQQMEKEELEESINNVLKKEVKKGEPVIDILEINKLKRQLIFQAYIWDQRLLCATGSRYSPHELLNGLLAIFYEKAFPTVKLEDPNVVFEVQNRFASTRASDSGFKIDEIINDGILDISLTEEQLNQPNCLDLYPQKTIVDVENFDKEQNKLNHSACASERAKLEPPVSEFSGNWILTDGPFPILESISSTFDAKWRGENGPVFSSTTMLDSIASVDSASIAFEDAYENFVSDDTQTSNSVFHCNSGDSKTEFPSKTYDTYWIEIPFLHLYRSINKNLENPPKLGALNEYNSVFVSLFQELRHQGGGNLLLPVGQNEIVIPVFEVEPTSVISYALTSAEYYFQVSDDREKLSGFIDSSLQSVLGGSANLQSSHSIDEDSSEVFKRFGSTEDSIWSLSGSRNSLDPAFYTNAIHARISFDDDCSLEKYKYTVICYFAKHFDSLRRECCSSELDFIRSLSRCKKWGAHGGKSNAFFAKSLDNRFIIKQMTKTEIESFIKFAPEYFNYLSESISCRNPTCLAKILGIYQVTTLRLKSGKEKKMDVLVMENLLFGRDITRLYDLKGSLRARYNADSNGDNKVLLDQNLIEAMPTSPLFLDKKAKHLLERAIWNDTAFLTSIGVMDYSLLVGVDESKNELVLGIIDFMRQYTWDKHLETWVKTSRIFGRRKNSPTVISPVQYRNRFRKAMSEYFPVVHDKNQQCYWEEL